MLLYQTRNGVFGRPANGGGIFNNAISGLGALGATLQKGLVPPSRASSISAAAKQCIDQSCKNLDEDQLKVCITACNAKAAAVTTAKPTSSGGGGVAPPAVSPTAAQAAMYQPSGLSQKMIAIAVGGVAAAAFVYLYMTKKKKG